MTSNLIRKSLTAGCQEASDCGSVSTGKQLSLLALSMGRYHLSEILGNSCPCSLAGIRWVIVQKVKRKEAKLYLYFWQPSFPSKSADNQGIDSVSWTEENKTTAEWLPLNFVGFQPRNTIGIPEIHKKGHSGAYKAFSNLCMLVPLSPSIPFVKKE